MTLCAACRTPVEMTEVSFSLDLEGETLVLCVECDVEPGDLPDGWPEHREGRIEFAAFSRGLVR